MKTNLAILASSTSFIVLTLMITTFDGPLGFEMGILQMLSEIRTPTLNTFIHGVTTMADLSSVMFLTVIFGGLLLIQQKIGQAISFVNAIILGTATMQIAKLIIDRPRPEQKPDGGQESSPLQRATKDG